MIQHHNDPSLLIVFPYISYFYPPTPTLWKADPPPPYLLPSKKHSDLTAGTQILTLTTGPVTSRPGLVSETQYARAAGYRCPSIAAVRHRDSASLGREGIT